MQEENLEVNENEFESKSLLKRGWKYVERTEVIIALALAIVTIFGFWLGDDSDSRSNTSDVRRTRYDPEAQVQAEARMRETEAVRRDVENLAAWFAEEHQRGERELGDRLLDSGHEHEGELSQALLEADNIRKSRLQALELAKELQTGRRSVDQIEIRFSAALTLYQNENFVGAFERFDELMTDLSKLRTSMQEIQTAVETQDRARGLIQKLHSDLAEWKSKYALGYGKLSTSIQEKLMEGEGHYEEGLVKLDGKDIRSATERFDKCQEFVHQQWSEIHQKLVEYDELWRADSQGNYPIHSQASTHALDRAKSEKISGEIERMLRLDRRLLDLRNQDGMTPLLLAIYPGRNVKLVRFLLAEGADPLLREDGMKNQALHHIARFGNGEMVDPVLNAPGVDVDAINGNGHTPLMIAVLTANVTVVESLLSAPTLPSFAVSDASGDTPLHIVADKGNMPIFEMLLPYYLENLDISNIVGETPLDLARRAKNREIVERLRLEMKRK